MRLYNGVRPSCVCHNVAPGVIIAVDCSVLVVYMAICGNLYVQGRATNVDEPRRGTDRIPGEDRIPVVGPRKDQTVAVLQYLRG